MSIRDQIEYHLWWLLQELEKEAALNDDTSDFIFDTTERSHLSPTDQRKLLFKLARLGAIGLNVFRSTFANMAATMHPETYDQADRYKVQINRPVFNQVYAQYQEKFPYDNKFPAAPGQAVTSVSLELDGSVLSVVTPKGKHRIRKLTADMRPHIFISFLLFNKPNQTVGRGDLNNLPQGIVTTDLAELVRQIGFNNQLKAIFFPVCSKDNVKLQPKAEVKTQQLQDALQSLNQAGKKPVKKQDN